MPSDEDQGNKVVTLREFIRECYAMECSILTQHGAVDVKRMGRHVHVVTAKNGKILSWRAACDQRIRGDIRHALAYLESGSL